MFTKPQAQPWITQVIQGVMICLAFAGLIGCNITRAPDRVSSNIPGPNPTLATSENWKLIVQGIEWREMDLPTVSQLHQGTMVIVRLNPAAVTFRVHYSPGQPYSLTEWRDQLPQAAIILNGGFFNEFDQALGLLVSDGVVYGQSFIGFGGMVQVSDGGVRVRSLVSEPYQGEPLWQAVQAFPMLVEAGNKVIPQNGGFDERAWRTWAGQDRTGRILFGATHNLISLADLQSWLVASDLDLNMAFGLDGGRSTGMIINTPGHNESILPIDRLPTVIAVYSP